MKSTNQQLLWIASISLLVGGIGVMNIMLVSVTERTSEIGLKKAIRGKKKSHSLSVSYRGSMLTSIEVGSGDSGELLCPRVVSEISGAPTAISIPAIARICTFFYSDWRIFGFLPSVKAANLNPIDALRSE